MAEILNPNQAGSGLSPDHELRMLELMLPFARHHAEESNGKLVVLDIDPDKYPFQVGNHIEGEPMDTDFIQKVSGMVVPRFVEMADGLSEQNPDIIRGMRRALARNKNVHLATSHDGLIDPAIALAAVVKPLREQPKPPEFDMAISIGKMLKLLGYRIGEEGQEGVAVLPTIEVLQWLCNDIYVSVPHSRRIKTSPLLEQMPNEVAAYNRITKDAIKEKLAGGGVVFSSAWNGTTNKLTEAKEYLLGRVNDGTAKLVADKKSLVASMVLDVSNDGNSFIEFAGKLRRLSVPDEAHDVMESMAEWMTKKYKGARQYVYEKAEDPSNDK